MKVLTIVWVTLASLSVLCVNASAGARTETRPQTTSDGKQVEAQLSDLQNRYDERLKTLEDNMSLLTQKDDDIRALVQTLTLLTQNDDDIRALVQTLTSMTNSADRKVPMQALTSEATHAIAASNEVVKRMESFYTAMGTLLAIFIGGLTIVLTALGMVGGFLGFRQFKQAAAELLHSEIRDFDAQVQRLTREYSDAKAATAHVNEKLAEKAHALDIVTAKTENIVENVHRNNEVLTIASVAYMSVAFYIIQLRQTTDASVKAQRQLTTILASAFNSTNDILDKYKPTDDTILAWTLTIRGTIFHLRGEFESALRDFQRAMEVSHDRGPTLYNAACSACRLGLKKEALSYLERAFQLQPERRAEAKADPDLQPVWDAI